MKKFLSLILALAIALSLAACGGNSTADISFSDLSTETEDPLTDTSADTSAAENLFDTGSDELGSFGLGATDPPRDENGKMLPFEYNGGTMEIEYEFDGSGIAANAGFLLFVDGIPQPWKLNGEGDVAYIHCMESEGNNIPYSFTFSFTPVTGKAGDTLTLTVIGIINAQFQPDMVNTDRFGYYHNSLDSDMELHFNADPESGGEEGTVTEALSSVTVENVKMTANFEENQLHWNYGEDRTTDELLESSDYQFLTCNGETVYSNLDVSGESQLTLTEQLCGIPGNTYRVTFYANHQPLSDGTNDYWEVTLKKGEVSTVEAVLDLSKVDDFTTIYAVAVPVTESSDTAELLPFKTDSLLLYRQ